MATTPNLTIELTLADQKLIQDFTAFASKFQNLVNQNQTKVNAIQSQGAAKTVAIHQTGAAQVAAITAKSAATNNAIISKANAQVVANTIKRNAKLVANQKTWSQQMTAGLNSVVKSIRVFAVAYATMFVGGAIKGALDFAGALADIADNLNLTTKQVYGLQQALIAVGKSPDAVTTLFDKLRDLSDTQKEAFGVRGVDINDNVAMFNALLQDSSLRAEILGARLVGVADALAKQGKTIDELVTKYPGTIKDLDGVARGADEIGDAFTALNFQLKEQFASAIVAIGPQLKAFIQTLSEGLKKVDFEALAKGLLVLVKGISFLGQSVGTVLKFSAAVVNLNYVLLPLSLLVSGLVLGFTRLTSSTKLLASGRLLNFFTAISQAASGAATTTKVSGFLQNFALGIVKVMRLLANFAGFIESIFTKIGAFVGTVFPRLGALIGKLPLIGWIISVISSLYRLYDALSSGATILEAFKYTFLSFINDLTFGLTPLDDYIKNLRKDFSNLDDTFSELKRAGWFDSVENLPSPVPDISQTENGKVDAIRLALENDIKTREARVKVLDAENEAIKVLMNDNDLSAEGYELLKDRLKENNEELDKFFGIIHQEAKTARELIDEMTEAWGGFSEETLRGRRALKLDLLDARRETFDKTTFFPQTLSGDFLQQLRARRVEIEKEIGELSKFITGKGATRDPQEIKAVTERIKQLKTELLGTDASGTSLQTYYQQAQNAASLFFDFQAQSLNNQLEVTQRLIELERQRWENQSNALREAGLESSVYYRNLERQFEQTEKRRLAKQESLQAKAFEQQKAANIAGTLMAGAQSFVEALPNFILAALVAALTAGQVGLIASQTNPYRRLAGGIIPGNRPGGDTVPTLLTPGEYVTNRQATANNLDLLERINSGQKINTSPNITVNINGGVINRDFVNNELLPLIRRGVKDGY